MSLLVVLAMLAAVALGYLTRVNIGLFAIAFAYLIACFGMGIPPGDLINLWPLKIFFVIFSVCLFYGFAIVNGTLARLAEHLIYQCRAVPPLLPFAVFLTTALIAGMGAGYYAALALMAPVTLMLCERSGMSQILGALAVNYGALGGANFVSSQSGVIFRSLMMNAGVGGNEALVYGLAIFAATMVIPLAVITAFMLLSGQGRHLRQVVLVTEPPLPLRREQRMTLWLTLLMMTIVLAAALAHLCWPESASVAFWSARVDIGLVAALFSVFALLLRLGNEREVIATLPWETLIMICGVGMLTGVALEAGTIDQLATWIGSNIPAFWVPLACCLVAAMMSLFASTLGVVAPALFPIVPPLATALGLDPTLLFGSIVVGSQASSISPFSSGGSLILGVCPHEAGRTALFPKLLCRAAPIGLSAALLFTLWLSLWF